MAKHDVQNVSYMRKDTHFLADGTWYISTPCPKCGLVDEQVSWKEAKTPHHAGLIADQRHVKCSLELDQTAQGELAEGEIRAAEDLLTNQERNYESWVARVAALRQAVKERPEFARELAAAEAQLGRHKHGLGEAQKRVAQTIASNRRALAA